MSPKQQTLYTTSIQKLSSIRARREARDMCELGLIDEEGKRVSMGERQIRQDYPLTPDEIKQLEKDGLLVSEEQNGELFFQLANESLVKEILAAKKGRAPKAIVISALIIIIGIISSVSFYMYQTGMTRDLMRYYFDSELIGTTLIKPEMVVVPEGRFMMGASPGDSNARANEKPAHRVTFNKAFAIGRYEITFEQYDMFAIGTNRPFPKDDGWGRGNRPVINVSWEDATAYAEWLSSVTGEKYRLPSEAEWEYAARAGSTSRYWWGNEIGIANAMCKGCNSGLEKINQTAPVGSFPANDFGIYDTAGNVSEWVQDCYQDNYMGAPTDGSAWETGNCLLRVLRGGSWYNSPEILRTSLRSGYLPDFKDNNGGGFRVAMDLP